VLSASHEIILFPRSCSLMLCSQIMFSQAFTPRNIPWKTNKRRLIQHQPPAVVHVLSTTSAISDLVQIHLRSTPMVTISHLPYYRKETTSQHDAPIVPLTWPCWPRSYICLFLSNDSACSSGTLSQQSSHTLRSSAGQWEQAWTGCVSWTWRPSMGQFRSNF